MDDRRREELSAIFRDGRDAAGLPEPRYVAVRVDSLIAGALIGYAVLDTTDGQLGACVEGQSDAARIADRLNRSAEGRSV